MNTNSMWHPGIPVEYRDRVICGDARVLTRQIPDVSISLIFADPVYDRIADYEYLAVLAKRVLKPGGSLLCWHSIGWLPDQLAALATVLNYRWQFIEYRPNEVKPRHSPNGRSTYSCLTWWDCGNSRPAYRTVDCRSVPVVVLSAGQATHHNWGKSERTTGYYMGALSLPGDVVLDPFCGSGTVPAVCKQLGRHYIAFEIDPATAHNAQHRIDNTQPPLFVLDDEQLSLNLE